MSLSFLAGKHHAEIEQSACYEACQGIDNVVGLNIYGAEAQQYIEWHEEPKQTF